MATLLNPIIPQSTVPTGNNYTSFKTTEDRFFTLFKPIQQTSTKQSDISAYILTPIIDFFILEPAFFINCCIELLNTFASLAKAAYYWSNSQQQTESIIQAPETRELEEALDHFKKAVVSQVAYDFNALLSFVALFTRPIASLVHHCSESSSQASGYTLLAN